MKMDLSGVSYIPILSISQAEMTALTELPDKDKDLMLPMFPMKGWGASIKLENSIDRIKSSIGHRPWIADIDDIFLQESRRKIDRNLGFRNVHEEVCLLDESYDGYKNWYEFVKNIPEAIPTLQLRDLTQLEKQMQRLESLERGVVIRLPIAKIEAYLPHILLLFYQRENGNFLLILDLENVDSSSLEKASTITDIFKLIRDSLSDISFSISGSSFPSSFSKQTYGENSIYERLIFNQVKKDISDNFLIYSDRGSARAGKIGGGSPHPPPRIDYPLSNDWRFIRFEYNDPGNPQEGEKKKLYTAIAKEMIQMNYWQSELRLWGTQMIELTSQGNSWGINAPGRATAVRINIHMHQQLCYNTPTNLMDTDEDWTD